MPKVARLNDRCEGICYGHSSPIPMIGKITTGTEVFRLEDLPVARIGDIVTGDCGHTGVIVTGGSFELENQKVARVGDSFTGVYVGVIVEGSTSMELD